MKRLRILCYNIHGGRSIGGKRDIPRIHALMERLDIDIGVFQEVECRTSRVGYTLDIGLLAGESRPHRLVGTSMVEGEGWYGNLIVSRFPIRRGIVHNLETKPDFEPRNAVDALIDSPLGAVRVIGTHLSLSYIERFSEARNLRRLMQEVEAETSVPLLLMGDINEWQPRSKLIRYLDAEMQPLPIRPTFPAFLPLLRLDRVWHDVPLSMQVIAHRLAGKGFRTVSDHLPIVVELAAEAGTSAKV